MSQRMTNQTNLTTFVFCEDKYHSTAFLKHFAAKKLHIYTKNAYK